MRLALQVAAVLIPALVLVVLSTIESAYEQTGEVALHVLRGESRADKRQAFFEEIMTNRPRFQTALLFGIQVCVVSIVVLLFRVGARLENKVGLSHLSLSVFVGALVLICLCRLLLPRLVSQNNPERVLVAFMPIFKPYYRLVSLPLLPFEALIASMRRRYDASVDEPEDDEEVSDTTMSDIQAFIDLGAEEGIIEESEGLMIQSIVEFGDRVVGEVMTPRSQMVAVDIESTILAARDVMVASKHSRLPVFRDQIDNVEGVLYVRDLIAAWGEGREGDAITTIMRPAYFVPEVKPVADLLEEMRKSNVQIALVIDEYGSVAGVVTIEDLLEEIVGEIEDEDVEEDEGEIVVHDDGSALVRGSTEIRKIELHYDTELEADDFTTVAGLIISELGHLPAPGERLDFKNLEFEVLEADSRRVNLVRLRRATAAESDTAKEAPQP